MKRINLLLLTVWVTVAQCQRFNAQDAALAMLERVNEPLFIPKCEKGILLEVPDAYMPDRYRPVADPLRNRFSDGVTPTSVRIPIKMVTVPDISDLLTLPRLATYSNFVPMHRNLGSRLISIFMEMRSVEDFFSVAAYVRDRINPSLFVYGFSVALLHRPDCRNIRVPPVTETFPGRFVDGAVFGQAREESTIMNDQTLIPMRAYIEIPRDYTATDRETEHRLAYFREDLGINLHHWHWHLVYPFVGPREVVQKDRRGELFYYMHQQVLARYDFERMSNKLPRTIRLLNFQEPIVEAYFPKLSSQVASRNWASRSSGVVLKNIDRETDQLKYDIADLDRWRARLLDAIHRGRVDLLNGSSVALTEMSGIDMLGDMVEATELSLNSQFYGDLHNLVHVAVALVHDPDHRHLETFSVLGEASTAMRDPVFYRIHAMINDIFNMHKQNLQRYTVQQLDFPGVKVTGIELKTPTSGNNVFETFWQKNLVDLSRGMDFFPRGAVYAKMTHLNHSDFSIKINVENKGAQRQGLVRIMLAPQRDDRGQILPIVEQKNLFIELDKFIVDLRPGINEFTRNSRQSAVTIPFEQTFRDLETGRPADNSSGPVQDQFNFCGCGWPHHMLIPRGSPEGFPSVLFVMVSNLETDWNPPPANAPQNMCANAASYCGLRGQNYPDRRAMGYPFDRLPRSGAVTLQSFLTPNMGVQNVTIRFMDRTVDNTPPSKAGSNPRVVPGFSPNMPPPRSSPPKPRQQRPTQASSRPRPKQVSWDSSNQYVSDFNNVLSNGRGVSPNRYTGGIAFPGSGPLWRSK